MPLGSLLWASKPTMLFVVCKRFLDLGVRSRKTAPFSFRSALSPWNHKCEAEARETLRARLKGPSHMLQARMNTNPTVLKYATVSDVDQQLLVTREAGSSSSARVVASN
jgi:hypothetical protein